MGRVRPRGARAQRNSPGVQEQLFEKGRLRATVRHFEEAVSYHVAGDAYTGVFGSVAADGDGRGPAVVDACRAYLRNQSADDRPLLRGAK